MKKLFLLSFLLVIVLSLNITSGIKNSHHDFSGKSWANNQTCIPCHTPHNAKQDVQNTPLWNHMFSSNIYDTYSNSSINATIGQPNGVSKLCLSCHDGSVAIDNYGTKTNGTITYGGKRVFGSDLGHEHPISFDYNSTLANVDGELYDPASQPSGLGGTINKDMLFGGKLECSSCHDVHISRNTSEACSGCHSMHPFKTTTLSLRKSNAGSALCLTCHKK